MAVGVPVLGLSTTELGAAIQNFVSGHVEADLDRLADRMRDLLEHPGEARRLGEGARRYARERFNQDRFIGEWIEVFAQAVARGRGPAAQSRANEPRAAMGTLYGEVLGSRQPCPTEQSFSTKMAR